MDESIEISDWLIVFGSIIFVGSLSTIFVMFTLSGLFQFLDNIKL